MNIVEKEALKFNERGFYKSARTLESLKSNLTTKLYGFNRERDRLDFLKILREKTISDKEEHAKNCSGCSYDETRNIALFSIDQEIDDINRLYLTNQNRKTNLVLNKNRNYITN
ncbi:hypothetical protein [Algibacter lectus]|uniref:hypothetical protein n=1 Tax=Algibacter lectus TaxID=221126 RepID=UPI0005A7952E|nr:hypothetical protein [Algibacter lectus]